MLKLFLLRRKNPQKRIRILQNIHGAFLRKQLKGSIFQYFCKKAPPHMFDRILNKCLISVHNPVKLRVWPKWCSLQKIDFYVLINLNIVLGSEDAIITSAYNLHIAQNFYRVGSYKTYDEVTNYTVKKLDCDCRQCLQYKKTENSQGRFSYETVETNECEVESKCSCYDCQKENFDNSDSVFFEENQKYTCTFCDRSFTWFGNFQKHIFKHKGTERVENARSSLQGKYQNYVIRDTSSSLRCGVCFKSFTRLSTLRIHIRMHNGERPFTCEKCDISFTTNRALKMYLRIHSNFRPFKCNLCTKTFTRKDELKAHSYAHTGNYCTLI